MTASAAEVNEQKKAPDVEGLLPAIRERWSPRAFSDRTLTDADLRRVFEAARWAPSSSNAQPWHYVYGVRGSETFAKIVSALVPGNQDWAPKAGALIVGTTKKTNAKGGENFYALYDLGAATALLVVEATGSGLAAHQMGGYDRDAMRKALGIPEDFALGSVIAVGYQGDPDTLPNPTLIEREVAPRTRKPLAEGASTAWGEPATL